MAECVKIGAKLCGKVLLTQSKIIELFSLYLLTVGKNHYNNGYKNEKKVEKTKATLVRELEEKLGVNKVSLTLERANKETIVKLINL